MAPSSKKPKVCTLVGRSGRALASLRGRGGVTLTEEGSRVLPYLREIVKWNERLTQTVSSLSGLITGTLRIGSFSSIAAHWLPQIIKRFQSDYPNIKIEITEGGAGNSILEAGRLT